MLQLKEKFTQYQLVNVLTMKSKYSPRLYEILKCNEFKKQGYMKIDIEELRKLLKAENIYPKYNDFKRYIIERTQKELRKTSDIYFDFEEIKTGRKVTSLRFYIYPNKNKALDEISVTSTTKFNASQVNPKIDDSVKQVLAIMNQHEIEIFEAKKIYDSSNGDLAQIEKCYKYCCEKKVDNIVGYMINLVKPGAYIEPKKNYNKDTFNNYNQRTYEYDELEKKLLGLDT